jgi:predicted nucleic acid-binding protein
VAERIAQRDPDWIVPHLWRYEVTNVLTTLARNKVIQPELAEAAILDAVLLASPAEAPIDQVTALRTALRLGISAYDAQYITLAQSRGVRCVTGDDRLVRKAIGIAIRPADFIAGH